MEGLLRAYFTNENTAYDASCPGLALEKDSALTAFCEAMTREDEEPLLPTQIYVGMWRGAHIKLLAHILAAWKSTAQHPLLQIQAMNMEGVTEDTASFDRVMAVPFHAVDRVEDIPSLDAFLHVIGGARGLLTLLGIRCTVGSQVVCPPTRAQCMDAFNRKHAAESSSSILTIGARQWTKHVQRCLNGWWGQNKGSEAAKNAIAAAKIAELLDATVWMNVHGLPNGPVVFEIRQAEGYGARWGFQGNEVHFRGFVEPYMENGHELSWRH
ncbi:Aste57867_20920 [Aphanomyces stellatus]|uniref:Aste57867_20920 protein n=1 Tax=Aphanomyces stellatus TaxID=120398 RepID=A0A485LG69_9STRA|nr:hypothetical protein As57867_020852 [Aphanomyces stellatus]VFT97597.1 Aste57867_20920 [Aphanomyces stellatus]